MPSWPTLLTGLPLGARTPLYHRLFIVAVALKGLDGVIELAGGVALLFLSKSDLSALVDLATTQELSEDPNDIIAGLLRRWFLHLSAGAEHFAAIYLLAHGAIKMVLAYALLRDKIWAFPVAAACFLGFIT